MGKKSEPRSQTGPVGTWDEALRCSRMLILMLFAPLLGGKAWLPQQQQQQQQLPDRTSGLMRSARSLMDALTAPACAAALHLNYLHMQSYRSRVKHNVSLINAPENRGSIFPTLLVKLMPEERLPLGRSWSRAISRCCSGCNEGAF